MINRKTKGKNTPSSGDRGTPLFTSINSNALGPMYFSDDISAISYMISCMLLGKLPWESCKSSEEILEVKKTNALESQLKDYPLLLKFVTAFKTVKTDVIDYSYWVDMFRKAAKANAPEAENLDFLPLKVYRTEEKNSRSTLQMVKTVLKTKPRSSRKQEPSSPISISSSRENSESNSQKDIQEIINRSPSSAKNLLKRKQSASLEKASKKRIVTPTRIQPPRACKHV